MKLKTLYILLFFSCFQGCTSLEVNRVAYETMLGFTINEKQAKNLKHNYFELGYHDDLLLSKKMKNNKINNNYAEYFQISSAKKDSIKNTIDKVASTKFVNGSRTIAGIYRTTFTEKEDYDNYLIINKETYGQSFILYDIYVTVHNNVIALKAKEDLNMNNELNKGSYGSNSSVDYEKYYHDEFGKLLLSCNYSYREGECYVCKEDEEGIVDKIETFKLSDFSKMKHKYFPFQNISYLENEEVHPQGPYLESLHKKTQKNTEYLTEIGTQTSKEFINQLNYYQKITYENKAVKKIEIFKEHKLSSIQYYLDKTESLEAVKSNFTAYETYTLIETSNVKNGSICIYYHFKNNQLVAKERVKEAADGRVLAKEVFKKEDFDKVDYSKSMKVYHDSKRNIHLVFYYKRNGLFKDVFYKTMNGYSSLNQSNFFSWWKLKDNFFPNDDLKFYRSAMF